jgi:anti-sigma regulatory factor (Ser/Thr protein kinase)
VTTTVAQRSLLAVPPNFSGEGALAGGRALLEADTHAVIDARRLRDLDAVGAATFGLSIERAHVAGDDLLLLPPRSRVVTQALESLLSVRRDKAAPGASSTVVVPATAIADRADLRTVAASVGDSLAPLSADIAHVAQITVATLVDNALRHGGGPAAPVLVVAIDDAVAICVRDLGGKIADCADVRRELVRRIQLPAQAHGAAPGSPVGIAWLAELIERRDLPATLTFAAGEGRLTYQAGSWRCHSARFATGFTASARLALPKAGNSS